MYDSRQPDRTGPAVHITVICILKAKKITEVCCGLWVVRYSIEGSSNAAFQLLFPILYLVLLTVRSFLEELNSRIIDKECVTCHQRASSYRYMIHIYIHVHV